MTRHSWALLTALLTLASGWPAPLQAQRQWTPVPGTASRDSSDSTAKSGNTWTSLPQEPTSSTPLIWEPLSPEQASQAPEALVWSAPPEPTPTETDDLANQADHVQNAAHSTKPGLRWPNGQVMSAEDQVYFRSAWSRGSMIQIGDTVYPNLGFNALQRHPNSWGSAAIAAIDDTRIGSPDCETGNFFDQCADGLLEARVKLWNSPALSLDAHWTMHSLSGEGAPFQFSVDGVPYGDSDTGTKFGEGNSLGFVLSKNFGKTFGITFAGYRLFHLDETTDLPRTFALFGTKIFRLNHALEPPILSLSLGLMTDVFNPVTNLGTITYPKSLRGGYFPSTFADRFDDSGSGYSYYDNVAGVSSQFVCADRSVFVGKPISSVSPSCIEEVYVGPMASIGFAPWPWLGFYAKYGGTDLDLGVSLKPFKSIPWTLSLEAAGPIKGINPTLDDSFDFKECKDREHSSFSDCRTRVGIYTNLSF